MGRIYWNQREVEAVAEGTRGRMASGVPLLEAVRAAQSELLPPNRRRPLQAEADCARIVEHLDRQKISEPAALLDGMIRRIVREELNRVFGGGA